MAGFKASRREPQTVRIKQGAIRLRLATRHPPPAAPPSPTPIQVVIPTPIPTPALPTAVPTEAVIARGERTFAPYYTWREEFVAPAELYWWFGSWDGGSAEVVDQALIVTMTAPEQWHWNAIAEHQWDYHMLMSGDLTFVEAGDDGYAGLLCRVNISQGEAPELLKPAGTPNRIAAECISDELALFLNGVELLRVRDGRHDVGASAIDSFSSTADRFVIRWDNLEAQGLDQLP